MLRLLRVLLSLVEICILYVNRSIIFRGSMGGESIAPYWVEDIERVRADLDEIDKKRKYKRMIVLWGSWCSGEHLQGSCVCHVR